VPLRFDHPHLSRDAFMDLGHNLPQAHVGAALLAGHEYGTSAPGSAHELGDRCRRDADRLFAIDVLPRAQSGDRHFNVEIAWRGNHYCLDVRAFEEPPVVCHCSRLVAGCHGRGPVQPVRLVIAQGGNFRPRLLEERPEQCGSAIPDTDQACAVGFALGCITLR